MRLRSRSKSSSGSGPSVFPVSAWRNWDAPRRSCRGPLRTRTLPARLIPNVVATLTSSNTPRPAMMGEGSMERPERDSL